jgi:epoxyqueuosine reductase QueG
MFRKTARTLIVVALPALMTLGTPAESAAGDKGKGRYVTRYADGRDQARPTYRRNARSEARRSNGEYREWEDRSKTKTALMIGGAAATGAGVGGAMGGTKGALIGAAVGGGAASIYEAVKRR